MAAQRPGGQARAQRADRVGQRAERALERPGAVRGDDRQADARRVEERPVAGAEDVDRPLARRPGRDCARRLEVERQVDRGAKSFAVPVGMTASGRPAAAAATATGPIDPSPPATARRSGAAATASAAARSTASSPSSGAKAWTETVAPASRSSAATRSPSVPPPDAAFVTRATRMARDHAHIVRGMRDAPRTARPVPPPSAPVEPGARRSLRALLRGGPVAKAVARADLRLYRLLRTAARPPALGPMAASRTWASTPPDGSCSASPASRSTARAGHAGAARSSASPARTC